MHALENTSTRFIIALKLESSHSGASEGVIELCKIVTYDEDTDFKPAGHGCSLQPQNDIFMPLIATK